MLDSWQQQKRDAILAECTKRKIKVEQGEHCYLLRGPGVDLMAADLAHLAPADLAPHRPLK